jgi:Flp pilus assembly pilin Flp
MFKQVAKQARATQRGQGMTEYIIIVALIAVAAIITYQFFGSAVRNQTASIASEIGGDQAAAKTAADKAEADGKAATTDATNKRTLSDYSSQGRPQ